MAYRLHEQDPDHDAVRQLTLVPFLDDGACVAIRTESGRLAVPSGRVEPGESWLLDSSLRIPLMTAGFRIQLVHPFAIDSDHVYAWVGGDRYTGRRPHVPAQWRTGTALDVAGWLDDQGDEALAGVVRDAGRSFAAQDDASYYADNLRLLEPAYLLGTTPQAGSGSGSTPEEWRQSREMVVEGIDHDGTFLDVGCANGLLMESVHEWAAERGLDVQPYGVDLGPRLVALARERLPHWADRIEVGNAIDYVPSVPRRFTYVHALADAVPVHRRRDLMAHLRSLVEPGGRFLLSVYRTAPGPGAAALIEEFGLHADGEAASVSGKHTTAWIAA